MGIVFGERRKLCKTICMKKGIDYTGITVSFYCHDGNRNFVLLRRGQKCRDEQGRWDFGGGGLKFGETLEECLKREVREEYGTEPQKFEFLGHDEVFRELSGEQTHWIGFRYKVLLNREVVINAEPDKHDEIGWFTLDNLPSPRHSQSEKQIIKYRTILEE